MLEIPYVDFGGQGQLLHFAHGNGYPPTSYKSFCSHLPSQYRIIATKMRPLWHPAKDPFELESWDMLADDLITFMESSQMKDVIGIGHSLGGTISVLAAHKKPELFNQLILLDPVILSKESYLKSENLSIADRKVYNPFAKACLARRDHWSEKSEVLNSWRTKKVFRKFSESALKDLVDASIVEDRQGVRLAYSKEWESHIYVTEIYILDKLLNLNIPITVLRAGKGSIISDEVWSLWQSKATNTSFLEFDKGSHLLPMEFPKEVAAIVNNIITQETKNK